MKIYIGRVISITFTDRYPIEGLIRDCNDNWILMKPLLDYMIGGYALIRNKNIESYKHGANEKRKNPKIKGIKIVKEETCTHLRT